MIRLRKEGISNLPHKCASRNGFTLIEICVVMVIIGLLLVGVLQAYTIYEAKALQERTNIRMATIEQTLKDFYEKNGRLPCPAPINGSTAGNNFDQENCTTNILNVPGTNSQRVLIGKLPAATLSLSNDFMRDVYGSYLTYAVSQMSTTEGGSTEGAITLREENIDRVAGSSTYGQLILLENHQNITHLVVSSGKSRKGAYNHEGQRPNACSGTSKDRQNCDDNATFMLSLLSNVNDENSPNFYDDRLIFKKDSDMAGSVITLRRAIPGQDYETIGSGHIRMNKEGYVQAAGTFAVAAGTPGHGTTVSMPQRIYRINNGDEIQFRAGGGFGGPLGQSSSGVTINNEPLINVSRQQGVTSNPNVRVATQNDHFVMSTSGTYMPPNYINNSTHGNSNNGVQSSGSASFTLWVKAR